MRWFRKSGSPYRIIDRAKACEIGNSWQSPQLPEKQWEIVSSLFEKYAQSGHFPVEVRAMFDLLKNIESTPLDLLEIGCSSGYISQMLKRAGYQFRYTGLDNAPAFIKFAREKYPNQKFILGDAINLPLPDHSIDVVLSGSCLLHILDYPQAIAETARVAKNWILFHKTPILHLTSTTYTMKETYDIRMFEIQFNETELFSYFRKFGLILTDLRAYAQMVLPELPEPIIYKDYLCRVS